MKILLKLIGLLCLAVMVLLIGDILVEYFWPRHHVFSWGGMDL